VIDLFEVSSISSKQIGHSGSIVVLVSSSSSSSISGSASGSFSYNKSSALITSIFEYPRLLNILITAGMPIEIPIVSVFIEVFHIETT
jgi:hypothetical protein